MDWTTVLHDLDALLAGDLGRSEQAVRAAALIRRAARYHWVGLYAVAGREIVAVGWSGPRAPAHPQFPVTRGLSGAAVASGRAVVVNDVTADPRYLTAFASTLSEAIIPVVDPATGTVVGTLAWRATSGTRSATPTVACWNGARPRSRACSSTTGRRATGDHPPGPAQRRSSLAARMKSLSVRPPAA